MASPLMGNQFKANLLVGLTAHHGPKCLDAVHTSPETARRCPGHFSKARNFVRRANKSEGDVSPARPIRTRMLHYRASDFKRTRVTAAANPRDTSCTQQPNAELNICCTPSQRSATRVPPPPIASDCGGAPVRKPAARSRGMQT
eukprot:scaffold238388_cov40-Tisochrysis_lutea.AAC.1